VTAAPQTDSHVHTEWSWDAPAGSMEGSCARAVELGLPAIAFTEHVDLTRWVVPPRAKAGMSQHHERVGDDDRFAPPPLDLDGYLDALERCRATFPGLRILSGVELGEPHWFADHCRALLASGGFDRVLGSQHSVTVGDRPWIVDDLDGPTAPPGLAPHDVVRAYLAETLAMIEGFDAFAVLAHVNYPARGWPARLGPFPVQAFEEAFREVLAALAASDRALEINTRVPFQPELLAWWAEAGGRAVSFGSDAHEPAAIARCFADAAELAEAAGFRPGRHPYDLWRR
jgi:histidinol-phosphatase (PHP family)